MGIKDDFDDNKFYNIRYINLNKFCIDLKENDCLVPLFSIYL